MKFYFTAHPGDLISERILDDARIMLVASAHWDDERKRFKVRRPPSKAEHIAVDSGGFVAARRWGSYPWSYEQYVDFIHAISRDVTLDFCATMDYACERGVDRSVHATNVERIEATIENEQKLREIASGLHWLPVLQGNTLEERALDIELRQQAGMSPDDYAGIGSICGRSPSEAIRIMKFYAVRLPGVQFHGFGMHVRALDDDHVYHVTRSWDSYSWTWGRGLNDVDRPHEYFRQGNETWSQYTARLARLYWENTVKPRLTAPRNIPMNF
jgi:hypothetical protein